MNEEYTAGNIRGFSTETLLKELDRREEEKIKKNSDKFYNAKKQIYTAVEIYATAMKLRNSIDEKAISEIPIAQFIADIMQAGIEIQIIEKVKEDVKK